MAIQSTDGRRLRGERTRLSILEHAARVGSAEGLEEVSMQRLADDLGISKSGLFAHFGSKEELHLATIDAVAQVFVDEVVRPALAQPRCFFFFSSRRRHTRLQGDWSSDVCSSD